MPDLLFAERILSPATPREKAATIVGDFAESSRGNLQFWTSVFRTTGSLVWKSAAAGPGRMLVLAGSGFVMQFAFNTPFLAAAFVLAAVLGVLNIIWLKLPTDTLAIPPFALMVFSAAVPAPWLTGRWLARRAPGRELAPCVTLTAISTTWWIVAMFLWREDVSLMNGLSGVLATSLTLLVANLAMYAGAIHVRRHAADVRWFELIPFVLLDKRERQSASIQKAQQRIMDWTWVGIALFLLLLQASGLLTVRGPVAGAVAAVLALGCGLDGLTGKPMGWRKYGTPYPSWLGRLGLLGMSGCTAWISFHAFRS